MNKNMYHNTTNKNNESLKKYQEKAEKQDQNVLRFCREMREFTASKIYKRFNENTPITSIRRSLNTLENDCLISKTTTKVLGMYGRPETLYISLEAC